MVGTGRPPAVARGLAAAGGASFLIAGVLTIAGCWERWVHRCRSGAVTDFCLLDEDHRYDHLVPSDPLALTGVAPVLAGAASVVLAVGFVLLFGAVRGSIWARGLQTVLVASVFGMGLVTLLSAWSGQPVGYEWVVVPWVLSPIFVATVLDPLIRDDVVLPSRVWLAWGAAILLANPVVQFLLTPVIVGSDFYNTTPWDGVISGAALVVAGLIVLAGLCHPALRRRLPAQR